MPKNIALRDSMEALIRKQRHALSQCTSLEKLKDMGDIAALAIRQAKKAEHATEAVNAAVAMKLLIDHRFGEVLRDMSKAKGSKGNQHTGNLDRLQAATSPTYADLGVEKTYAHRVQKMAEHPADAIVEYCERHNQFGEIATVSGWLRECKGDPEPKPEPTAKDMLRKLAVLVDVLIDKYPKEHRGALADFLSTKADELRSMEGIHDCGRERRSAS